jgi:hypothetical protein
MTLTILEALISITSPLVAIYLYDKNKKFIADLTKKNELFIQKIYQDKLTSEKNMAVLTEYLVMYNSSKDSGISALIKAGVASLNSNQDIKYVFTEIQSRTGKHPLGKYANPIEQAGLLKFFKNIDLQSFKESGGIENIIEKLNKDF